MRKYSIFLFILVLVMLAGCGNDDTLANQGETNEEQAVDSEETADEQEEAEEDEGEDDEKELSNKPTDTLGVLDAVAEAMSQLDGMALEGEIVSRVEMSGMVTMDETNEITGEVSFNPYVEHLNYRTTSELADGTEESEYYMIDQITYMFTSSEGWMILPMSPDPFGSVITESQFKTFSKHHDQFELSEENGNYLLSFEGSGDIYKEVIYGGLRDTFGEEAYQAITSIVEGVSGSYQLAVDKQTFHVASLFLESEMTEDGLNTETSVSFEYSKYNEVDDIVVPEDVIENAQKLPGMEPIDGE